MFTFRKYVLSCCPFFEPWNQTLTIMMHGLSHYWLWCPVIAPILGAIVGVFAYDAFFYTGEDSILNRPYVLHAISRWSIFTDSGVCL